MSKKKYQHYLLNFDIRVSEEQLKEVQNKLPEWLEGYETTIVNNTNEQYLVLIDVRGDEAEIIDDNFFRVYDGVLDQVAGCLDSLNVPQYIDEETPSERWSLEIVEDSKFIRHLIPILGFDEHFFRKNKVKLVSERPDINVLIREVESKFDAEIRAAVITYIIMAYNTNMETLAKAIEKQRERFKRSDD